MPRRLKILLDENVDSRIIPFLSELNIIVVRTPKGIRDKEVISMAEREKAILLTNDKDFANTELYPPFKFEGIIVIGIHPPVYTNIQPLLIRLFSTVSRYKNKLILLTNSGIEIYEE